MTELSGSDPPTPPVLGGAGPAGAPFPSGPGCLRLFFSTWFGEFGKKGERESAGLQCGPQPLGFPPGRSPAPCFTGQESAASEGAVRPGRGAHPHRPRGPAVPAPPAARTPRGASSPDPVRLRCGAARSGPSHPRDVCPLPEVPAGRGCVPGPLASAPPAVYPAPSPPFSPSPFVSPSEQTGARGPRAPGRGALAAGSGFAWRGGSRPAPLGASPSSLAALRFRPAGSSRRPATQLPGPGCPGGPRPAAQGEPGRVRRAGCRGAGARGGAAAPRAARSQGASPRGGA